MADDLWFLECITYHDGTRRMRERNMYGPFDAFEKAHAGMTALSKTYDDILVHRLTPYPEVTDEHPSAA